VLEKRARLKTRRLEKEASGMGKQIPAGGMFLMERDMNRGFPVFLTYS
jgi:hypothetical protein